MTIEKQIDGNTAVLCLKGWMDTHGAPAFAEALEGLEPEVDSLVLDLTDLEYTSSAGLRLFVTAHKKMKGALTIKNASAEVMDVFNMSGFSKKLHIET